MQNDKDGKRHHLIKCKHNLHSVLIFSICKGTDFANRTTTQSSPPIIVDNTPPLKTDKPLTISGRHITSDTEIEAW